MAAAAEPFECSTDRVTLEIKGAKLNVAIQHALRRKRSQDRSSPGPEGGGKGPLPDIGAGGHDANCNSSGGGGGPAGGGQGRQNFNSTDTGSAKEVALLKASVESLRAGLREKEDAVTQLEREKEGLIEQVERLEPITQENVDLAQKASVLENQIEKLKAKLTQADNNRALTMRLVDTLKSAQHDLRAAHTQVSQRCVELENIAEDSAEAVRRGGVLLHSQQLKIDSQSRQIKRQQEDLESLREERALQLTKAEKIAAELAQVLRRERAGQSNIADAHTEVEELKEELGHMREAFARHRSVIRRNQQVIDAHEKALKDARATADKNSAVRECGALRIEKDSLKDKLEEAGRKLDEVSVAAATKTASAPAGAGNTAKLRGEGSYQITTVQQHVSPESSKVRGDDIVPQTPDAPVLNNVAQSAAKVTSTTEQPRGISPFRGRTSFQTATAGAPVAVEATLPSSSITRPSSGSCRQQEQEEEPSEHPGSSLIRDGSEAPSSFPSSSRGSSRTGQDIFGGPTTSAADAGGGGGGGGDGVGSSLRGGDGGDGRGGNAGGGSASSIVCRPKHPRAVLAATDGAGKVVIAGKTSCAFAGGRGEAEAGAGKGGTGRHIGGSDGAISSGREASSGRRSRPRSPAENFDNDNRENNAISGSEASPASYSPFPCRTQSRKKAKADTTRGGGATAVADATDGDGGRGAPRSSSDLPLPTTSSAFRSRKFAAAGVAGSGEKEDVLDSSNGVCPSCGDTPYGLMINCSSCSRQHHSSCVPEERRVGRRLGAVFYCSECSCQQG